MLDIFLDDCLVVFEKGLSFNLEFAGLVRLVDQ